VSLAFTPVHHGGTGEPLVLVHGVMATWRTWELGLPVLERHHDALAPTPAWSRRRAAAGGRQLSLGHTGG
jgi:pimeloyl-ACP methyl ester carboxylesterase